MKNRYEAERPVFSSPFDEACRDLVRLGPRMPEKYRVTHKKLADIRFLPTDDFINSHRREFLNYGWTESLVNWLTTKDNEIGQRGGVHSPVSGNILIWKLDGGYEDWSEDDQRNWYRKSVIHELGHKTIPHHLNILELEAATAMQMNAKDFRQAISSALLEESILVVRYLSEKNGVKEDELPFLFPQLQENPQLDVTTYIQKGLYEKKFDFEKFGGNKDDFFRLIKDQEIPKLKFARDGRIVHLFTEENIYLGEFNRPWDRQINELHSDILMQYINYLLYLEEQNISGKGNLNALREYSNSRQFNTSLSVKILEDPYILQAAIEFGGFENLLEACFQSQEDFDDKKRLTDRQEEAVRKLIQSSQAQNIYYFLLHHYEANAAFYDLVEGTIMVNTHSEKELDLIQEDENSYAEEVEKAYNELDHFQLVSYFIACAQHSTPKGIKSSALNCKSSDERFGMQRPVTQPSFLNIIVDEYFKAKKYSATQLLQRTGEIVNEVGGLIYE